MFHPKKKHLLHRLVKKVLRHSRQTIEIWYMLPNTRRFADCNIWLPGCNSMRTRPGRVETEINFRMVHVAGWDGRNGGSPADYREQAVDITLGPKGAFENCNTRALLRRSGGDRVMSAFSPLRRYSIHLKDPKTPRVTELLRKAIEWRRQLDAGEVRNQADIARREGITRARVTQIMGILRVAPEMQEHILSMPGGIRRPPISERMLRPMLQIGHRDGQLL